jgi:hypothetical protein
MSDSEERVVVVRWKSSHPYPDQQVERIRRELTFTLGTGIEVFKALETTTASTALRIRTFRAELEAPRTDRLARKVKLDPQKRGGKA